MGIAFMPSRLSSTISQIHSIRNSFVEWSSLASRRMWYSSRRLWWHSYWDLSVDGAGHVPAHGPALLCSNHTSHLDAPAILAALPVALALRVSTAAARDVFGGRSVRGSLSRMMTNATPLERGGEFAGGLRSLERVLREGRPLILFPEGRRSPDGQLQQFKGGAAMLALRTGAPIIPIHLRGLHELLPRGHRLPLPGGVRVRFGEPIDPHPFQGTIADGAISRREAYGRITNKLRTAIAGLTADTHYLASFKPTK